MINGKKVLAIIPARGGSKRVVNKNIRDVCGLPLIGWTLRDLPLSRYIDASFVSTDNPEIQAAARQFGIDCEPLRPAHLATDTASSAEVVLDIIQQRPGYDIIVLLQPTSPLRTLAQVDEAIEFFISKSALSVTSVCETDCHPSWMSPLPEDKSIIPLLDKLQKKRSQDLETNFRLNGAIYVVDRKVFEEERSFFAQARAFAFEMSKSTSVDIDTEDDLRVVTALIKFRE